MGDARAGDVERADGTVRHARWRPRGRTIAILIAAACIVLYAIVVTLYALSGNVTALGPHEPEPESGGVTVVLNVEGVDAVRQRIAMRVTIDPSDTFFTGDRFSTTTDIDVIVSPVEGSQALVFKSQSAPSTKSIQVLAQGEIANWPFDVYREPQMIVLAYVSTDGVSRPIPTHVWLTGDVPGWDVDASQVGKAPAQEPGTLAEAITLVPKLDIRADRSGSTIVFAFVLLALLVAMPLLVLFVAITAYRGRRKLEPSFMGWMGAMLFATIPLRGFLPGSPPIGSWIDFTVVLWVVVGLIVGLAIYVTAWARWSHPEAKAVGPAP